MKRFISVFLLLAFVLSLFTVCVSADGEDFNYNLFDSPTAQLFVSHSDPQTLVPIEADLPTFVFDVSGDSSLDRTFSITSHGNYYVPAGSYSFSLLVSLYEVQKNGLVSSAIPVVIDGCDVSFRYGSDNTGYGNNSILFDDTITLGTSIVSPSGVLNIPIYVDDDYKFPYFMLDLGISFGALSSGKTFRISITPLSVVWDDADPDDIAKFANVPVECLVSNMDGEDVAVSSGTVLDFYDHYIYIRSPDTEENMTYVWGNSPFEHITASGVDEYNSAQVVYFRSKFIFRMDDLDLSNFRYLDLDLHIPGGLMYISVEGRNRQGVVWSPNYDTNIKNFNATLSLDSDRLVWLANYWEQNYNLTGMKGNSGSYQIEQNGTHYYVDAHQDSYTDFQYSEGDPIIRGTPMTYEFDVQTSVVTESNVRVSVPVFDVPFKLSSFTISIVSICDSSRFVNWPLYKAPDFPSVNLRYNARIYRRVSKSSLSYDALAIIDALGDNASDILAALKQYYPTAVDLLQAEAAAQQLEQAVAKGENFESSMQDSIKSGSSALPDVSGAFTAFGASLLFIKRYIDPTASALGDVIIIFTLPIFVGILFFILNRVAGATRARNERKAARKDRASGKGKKK